MDFEREWTSSAIEAEVDSFGAGRLVKAHNQQLTSAKKRTKELEDILWKCRRCIN